MTDPHADFDSPGLFDGRPRRLIARAAAAPAGIARRAWPAVLALLTVSATPFCAEAAPPSPERIDLAAADAETLQRGRYIAQLGGCVSCHTAHDGKPLAGGLALATPMGIVASTNITPDRETGIGHYTFEQFDRAMRRGVAADGHHLYPAMPYPSYARMTTDDMRTLYAYLQRGVVPVREANARSRMRWPFSMRWGIALWNWAFVDAQPYTADPQRDAVWNRGAYLVQGPGHCGACHTPRGLAFQEKAYTESGSGGQHYLAGETVEGWRALSLRKQWSVPDTVQLLKTGRNRYATVSGNMTDVVHYGTQHLSDADLTAIATYLGSLTPGPDDRPVAASAPADAAAARLADGASRGGQGYAQFCAGCHMPDGAGVKDVFPALADNPTIAEADPSTLVHMMLTGWSTPQTSAHPVVYTMPNFARLSDAEIAEILTFVRASWGRQTTSVSPADVKAARKRTG
jgi:thiosulfate dehydrogenase